MKLLMGHLQAALPFPGAHSSGQKPEQQNYTSCGNALAVCTVWLRAGSSDLSLPTTEKTEQVSDNEEEVLPLYFPASWWDLDRKNLLS